LTILFEWCQITFSLSQSLRRCGSGFAFGGGSFELSVLDFASTFWIRFRSPGFLAGVLEGLGRKLVGIISTYPGISGASTTPWSQLMGQSIYF